MHVSSVSLCNTGSDLLLPSELPRFFVRHRFNKMLETFLRIFGPYGYDDFSQLLQTCWLYMYDVSLFHQLPKVLYQTEIC